MSITKITNSKGKVIYPPENGDVTATKPRCPVCRNLIVMTETYPKKMVLVCGNGHRITADGQDIL